MTSKEESFYKFILINFTVSTTRYSAQVFTFMFYGMACTSYEIENSKYQLLAN